MFQYPVGRWVSEQEANVGKNGLHAALNPLDCLWYYGNMDESVYYLALADGDISEDGCESRISCTRMKLVKELSIKSFVMHAMNYVALHPYISCNSCFLQEDVGEVKRKFLIVRGKAPVARGEIGDILGFVKEEAVGKSVQQMSLYEVDGEKILPEVYYNCLGKPMRCMV